MLKDKFCWLCHRPGVEVSCNQCFRGYHICCSLADSRLSKSRELLQGNPHMKFIKNCNECQAIHESQELWDSNTHFKRMPTFKVNEIFDYTLTALACKFPQILQLSKIDYSPNIAAAMDWSTIKGKITKLSYGCSQAFYVDLLLINHNIAVTFGSAAKQSRDSKKFIEFAKAQIKLIDCCPYCISNWYIGKQDWFIRPCPWGHPLIYAKMKGYAPWPAKMLKFDRKKHRVYVYFFQSHTRSWIKEIDCTHFVDPGEELPEHIKNKGDRDLIEAMDEVIRHIRRLKVHFPLKVCFPPERLPLSIKDKDFIDNNPNDPEDSIEEKLDEVEESNPEEYNIETLDMGPSQIKLRRLCRERQAFVEVDDIMVKYCTGKPAPLGKKIQKIAAMLTAKPRKDGTSQKIEHTIAKANHISPKKRRLDDNLNNDKHSDLEKRKHRKELRKGRDSDEQVMFQSSEENQVSVQVPLQNSPPNIVQSPIINVTITKNTIQKPIQDSLRAPIQDSVPVPVQEPIQDPAQNPIQEPIQEPIQDPIQDTVPDPIQSPVKIPRKSSRILEEPRSLPLSVSLSFLRHKPTPPPSAPAKEVAKPTETIIAESSSPCPASLTLSPPPSSLSSSSSSSSTEAPVNGFECNPPNMKQITPPPTPESEDNSQVHPDSRTNEFFHPEKNNINRRESNDDSIVEGSVCEDSDVGSLSFEHVCDNLIGEDGANDVEPPTVITHPSSFRVNLDNPKSDDENIAQCDKTFCIDNRGDNMLEALEAQISILKKRLDDSLRKNKHIDQEVLKLQEENNEKKKLQEENEKLRNQLNQQREEAMEHEEQLNTYWRHKLEESVRETKKKTWCKCCDNEAVYFCCKLASYCSTICQKKHWPSHFDSHC